MQQEQNAVGRKVIGIAATGLKNYFGLVKYYNDYFNKAVEDGKVSPHDNSYFLREFTLVDKSGNPKTYTITKLAGLNLSEKASEILKKSLNDVLRSNTYQKRDGSFYSEEEITEVIDSLSSLDKDAALDISSILSLATDNAKELMLAKINAGIDFAGMHIYLIMLGVETEIVAKYMTSPKAFEIKNRLNSDFFSDKSSPSIIKKLTTLITPDFTEYKKKLNSLIAEKNSLLIKEDRDKIDESIKKLTDKFKEKQSTGIDQIFLDEFINIYKHAGELTSMGSILKVNQGSKASQEDLYKLANQLGTIVNNQEKNFYTEIDPQNIVGSQLARILEDKPYLKPFTVEVTNTLVMAGTYGISNGGKLDVARYFADADYRKVATDYYNLIKYTFNILDLLNNLPHFYNMYKAFITGDSYLEEKVQKYNFLKDKLSSVLKVGTSNSEITSFDIMKNIHLQGDKSMPISLSPSAINGANDYVDSMLLTQFLESLDFELDLGSLFGYLKEKGVSSIATKNSVTLLNKDKQTIKESSYSLDNLPMESIGFDNEYGRAQFRYLMETYIIPFLKREYKDNGFFKNYTSNQHKNFNLSHKVSFYMDPSNAGKLEELEVGINQLVDNSSSSKYVLPIKLMGDTVSNIKVLDLLSIYDMMINEGRFGGNRTTALMSKDIKQPNSVAYKYAQYQLEKESTSEFVDTLTENLLRSRDARNNLYLRMFGKQQDGIKVDLDNSYDDSGSSIYVNRYFTLPDSLDDNIINSKSEKIAKDIINITKSTYQN